MARKKRLNTTAVLTAGSVVATTVDEEVSTGYQTAAYVRLSMEDSGKIDGYSLQNQKDLLMSFINDHKELHLHKMYVDNGFSGTQFDRPAFDEMMEDMKAGRINCIVVKDLSRLGRNYLEAGNYLEQIFPFFKVRFISVTDGYDSITPDFTDEALIIPLKNIINEGYAKDISMKVSSALATRKRQGKFMCKVPLYGYLKDPADKNHLIIDPEAAPIVQRVFQMKLDGVSLGLIAKQMNDEGIPSPSKYFVLKGISKETKYLTSYWDRNTAKRMLTNRMYLGCLVYGKTVRSFARGIQRQDIASEDWQVIEGTHEPLVTEAIFNRVQELLEESSRQYQNHASYADGEVENLFRGMIRCGDCGSAMRMGKFRRLIKGTDDEYTYYGIYECSKRKMIYDYSCPQKSIRKSNLDSAVEESIRYHIQMFLDVERVIADLNKKTSVRKAATGLQEQIKKKQRRVAKVEQMSCGIYEDYQDGILTETEYLNLRKGYANEVLMLTREIDDLLREQTQYEEDHRAVGSLAELAHQYKDFSVLTREIIETFISEVRVHTGGKLTITFRFEDEFEKLQHIAEMRKEA